MAKKAAKAKSKKFSKATDLAPVEEIDVADHGNACMYEYGISVISDRALPDFRDGLLPVQRRTLWAAYKLGMPAGGGTKKSARLVGDVIGKYHPHGDGAAYDSLVNMVNSPLPYLYGQGNFGAMNDPAAAQRYTEVRFTKFGQTNFFSPDHIAVSTMVPNYDGREEEPLVLPSLLPNLLLNGSFGIAVGVTTFIPSFQVKGVAELVKAVLRKQKLETKDISKALKVNYAKYESGPTNLYKGGAEDKETMVAWRQFLRTGNGYAYVVSDYEVDVEARSLYIRSLPPQMNPSNLIDKVNSDPRVRVCEDESHKEDPFLIRVELSKDIGSRVVEENAEAIVEDYFAKKCHFKMNVIDQTFDPDTETVTAKLTLLSMQSFLDKWIEWRLKLEVDALTYRRGKTEEVLALTELMLLAANNIDTIVAALKRKDTEEWLAKQLKITAEQVDLILSRQIRSLKALERDKLIEKIAELKKYITQLSGWIKKPAPKLIEDIDALVASI